ncbi:MAG: AAA family ATPase [Pirellulales bacterium]|nr:AAA family ATPase [Pirellulales bacterium]
MKILVPIYVQQQTRGHASAPISVRPLFFPSPTISGTTLGKVIVKLKNKLRIHLADLGRQPRHDELLSWHRPEPLDDQVHKFQLDLRDSTATLKVLLVGLSRHGRRMVFSPSLPDLWFDVEQHESLEVRAREVYEDFFQQRRKEDAGYPVQRHGLHGKAWVDYVTIEVVPGRPAKKPSDPLRALLGGDDVSDGADQLRQVGRCLSWLDADELTEPIGVGQDVQRLIHLLDGGDRRGVVLVGPPGSGKTARIEGAVRHHVLRKQSATGHLVWHLSPARLISGMSYLGQWQQRVLAILKHAHQRDHVLYFDDFLGLYEAGKTRDSCMCVADTLRAQLNVHPVRVLAEMTPEAWAIFRERDRALADRFVVLPTDAMDTSKAMDVLIGVRRRLEADRKCWFDLDVLPEVVSLYDRFEKSSVLPGKAAAALARIAARGQQQTITRSDAVAEFQSRSGLRASIIDQRLSISRQSIHDSIRGQVVGQDGPVNRLIDCVLTAAARMNDTRRPLGTFLLVGPTGVGKTQLAKAVASCLFDDDGLIRLDMNELSSPASAARLIGTFDAPDGLLTSAVRRRPHAVLLLDEIEKAHPAVLDVLLQALGEARLSDARGRTVDLSGLLILMTSNLGSRQSGRGTGFADPTDSQAIGDVHRRAAEEFFRPEFFNRIDDVLSFQRLSAATMESIAWMQFQQILRRDGLQRRSVLIDVDPAAIRQAAARGYDPSMGARALKRQIERDLVGPAAEVLAASTTDQPTLLQLYLDQSQVCTRWQPIEYVSAAAGAKEISLDDLCRKSQSWLTRVADQIEGGPLRFEINGDGVDPAMLEMMTLRDSLHECRQSLRALSDVQNQPRMQRPQSTPVHVPGLSLSTGKSRFEPKHMTSLRDLQAIDDILDFLRDSLVETSADELNLRRDQFINELGRLHHQLAARGTATRWLVRIRWFGEDSNFSSPADAWSDLEHSLELKNHLRRAIENWGTEEESLVAEELDEPAQGVLCFSGALAAASLSELCGGWMFVQSNGGMSLADVQIRPVESNQSTLPTLDAWQQKGGHEGVAKVRRIIQVSGPLVDLATGAAISEKASSSSIVKLLRQTRRTVDFLDPAEEPA